MPKDMFADKHVKISYSAWELLKIHAMQKHELMGECATRLILGGIKKDRQLEPELDRLDEFLVERPIGGLSHLEDDEEHPPFPENQSPGDEDIE